MNNEIIYSSSSWDQYFMTMAYLISMRSKDLRTRVGAIIVGSDNEIRSTGYNGLPRNVSDQFVRYNNKKFKALASNHAEENAILQCARIGVSVNKCTIYTPWMPCALCSKMIIQSGINKVVYDGFYPGNKKESQYEWEYSIAVSLEMLNEAKVQLSCFEGDLLQISGLYKGEEFNPFQRIRDSIKH